MKITVTEEMREALRQREDARAAMRDESLPLSDRMKEQHRFNLRSIALARLVAEAVEEQERRCQEPECTADRMQVAAYCPCHEAEHREERERREAERLSGKPCVACVFVGSECADCQDYRETQAKKGGGDA